MKQAIVRWPIPTVIIGVSLVVIGVAIVVMSLVHAQDKPILPFEFVYLGVIVALVGIGLAVYEGTEQERAHHSSLLRETSSK